MGNICTNSKHIDPKENHNITNQFSDFQKKEFVNKFRPLLYLHSNEKYFPSTMEHIINVSSLYYNDVEIAPQIDADNFMTIVNQNHNNPKLYLKIPEKHYVGFNNVCPDAKCNEEETLFSNISTAINNFLDKEMDHDNHNGIQLKEAPVYYNTYDLGKYFVIKYWFIFPYNSDYSVCGCNLQCLPNMFCVHCGKKVDVGRHHGDVEHITVYLNKESNPVTVQKVYYSAHTNSDGVFVNRADIEFYGDRPIVYISRGSHACYPTAGTVFRAYNALNDVTNRGIKWDPETCVGFHDKDWAAFKGCIGTARNPPARKLFVGEKNIQASRPRIFFNPCNFCA